MAINLTRAWTAASLTPSIPTGATVPLPAGGTQTQTGGVNSLMAAIFGPNYQSLLNTSDRSGLAPPLTPELLNAVANQTAAVGYLTGQQARHDVLTAFPRLAQINQQRAFEAAQSAQRGGNMSDAIAANNALMMQTQNLAQAQKVAQYAALSPTYAPGMMGSVGQQNTGASWNPYARTSGWVSPVMGGSGSLGYGSAGSPSSMLMSMGI